MKPEFAKQREHAKRNRYVTIQCRNCDDYWGLAGDSGLYKDLMALVQCGRWNDVSVTPASEQDGILWAHMTGLCRRCWAEKKAAALEPRTHQPSLF